MGVGGAGAVKMRVFTAKYRMGVDEMGEGGRGGFTLWGGQVGRG